MATTTIKKNKVYVVNLLVAISYDERIKGFRVKIGSLSTDVFEPRTSTGSRDFSLMRISL